MIAVRRMVLVAAVAAAWLISVGSASAADGSYLYLRGEQGDYLVGESTRWYTNADAQFFSEYGCTGCSPTSPLQVSLRTPEDVTWAVAMAARTGERLAPQTYEGAQRFADATHPGLDVSGEGRGCNTVTGRFTVLTADFTGTTVNHFRATFEEHCEGLAPTLRGEVGFNVPVPPAPATGKIVIDKGAVATTSTSASLAISGTGIAQVRVSTDGAFDSETFQPFTPNMSITLPAGDGLKTVMAEFKNSVGFVSDASDSIFLDTTAPTGVKFTNPTACCSEVATTNPFRLAWTGTDATSGIQNYSLSYTSAPYNGGFGAPVDWATTNSTHKDFTGSPGTQYCFTLRAKDRAGNVSAPTKGCFVLPIDDSALGVSAGSWTRATGAPYYYLASYSRSDAADSVLVSPLMQGKRIGIVYTKCPGCGTIEVSFGGVVLGTVDTSARSATTTKKIAYFPRFDAVLEGVARVRAVSGAPVYLDGLFFSRS